MNPMAKPTAAMPTAIHTMSDVVRACAIRDSATVRPRIQAMTADTAATPGTRYSHHQRSRRQRR